MREEDRLQKHSNFEQGKLSASHGEWPTASLKGVEDKLYILETIVLSDQSQGIISHQS